MKETYGEYLFDAVTESIIECLAGITEEDVRDFSDFKIFNRGQEYYEEGMVEELMYNKANNTVILYMKVLIILPHILSIAPQLLNLWIS